MEKPQFNYENSIENCVLRTKLITFLVFRVYIDAFDSNPLIYKYTIHVVIKSQDRVSS